MPVNVTAIDASSPYLSTVKSLWRSNSDTLGFFPDGAFRDHAAKRLILVALAEGQCVGYLLYRITRQAWRGRISIVHLCVDQNRRGLGIAKALVNALDSQTQECDGIGLSCRRDYEVSELWPRLGFTAISDRPGRSHGAYELTYWWLGRNHPNLWTATADNVPESRITTVIDANVFYDLRAEKNKTGKGEESQAMLADWLQESVELCVTPELKNEINRNKDATKRSAMRLFADSFREVTSEKEKVDAAGEKIRKYFPAVLKTSDESDLRQVAWAIAADVQFFVTRDGPLLERSDKFYEEVGLRVLRPSDLIIHLDELRREAEYQPVSLAATSLKMRLANGSDQAVLTAAFQHSNQQETQDGFQKRLWRCLSSPDRFACQLAAEDEKKPLSLVVYDTHESDQLSVPLFRIARTKTAPTLSRYHVRLCLLKCAAEKRVFIRITDPYLDLGVEAALREDGFVAAGKEWIKAVVPFMGSAAELAQRLGVLALKGSEQSLFCQGVRARLIEPEATLNIQAMSEVERLLWPAKVLDAEIPSFIVPIQPKWAQHLFDTDLAKQTLFGADQALALSREGVYYRSASQKILTSPGRVLWYVSKSPSYEGTMSLRACSQIVEVDTGKPKDLFRRFQRLGVYKWSHIFNLAKNNLDNDLMAVRFRNTELFPTPIPYGNLSRLLRDQGCPTQFQSPLRISKEIFSMLYITATSTQANDNMNASIDKDAA